MRCYFFVQFSFLFRSVIVPCSFSVRSVFVWFSFRVLSMFVPFSSHGTKNAVKCDEGGSHENVSNSLRNVSQMRQTTCNNNTFLYKKCMPYTKKECLTQTVCVCGKRNNPTYSGDAPEILDEICVTTRPSQANQTKPSHSNQTKPI
jgi:hypothetical protein